MTTNKNIIIAICGNMVLFIKLFINPFYLFCKLYKQSDNLFVLTPLSIFRSPSLTMFYFLLNGLNIKFNIP